MCVTSYVFLNYLIFYLYDDFYHAKFLNFDVINYPSFMSRYYNL